MMLIGGCSEDYDLEKSIFYPDPEFPQLPMYSEWGYNTFGAFYDRQVFISQDDITPLKVIVKDDSTFFRFNGRLGYSHEMSMVFYMTDILPATYDQLTVLDQKTLDLNDPRYGVKLYLDGERQDMELLGGTVEFRKAQYLLVDKVPEEVILSGTFELQVVIDDEPFTISRGRFDVGVCYDNFFRFD